jgi:hypothetical protein
MDFPLVLRVRQQFDRSEIADAAGETRAALAESGLADRVKPGMSIAITAGSRGIDRIVEVLAALVAWLKEHQAKPFLVPAMGSHGGATAEGQLALLASLGITEAAIGAPIRSAMETALLGEVDGLPVHLDRFAAQADGIVVVNRIKPHTSFHGPCESGLVKMLAVGLGKREGAEAVHKRGPRALRSTVPRMAEFILAKAPVLFGLALLEGAYDRLARIEAVPAEAMQSREPGLLAKAKARMPGLPFPEIDVLVVDRIGKEISGTGMDTNVIGRINIAGEAEPNLPRIHRIVALDLSPQTGGSAYGIGLADLTTERLVRKMDPALVRENALASTFLERAKLPLAFGSDREAIAAALACSWCEDAAKARLVRIQDTLHLAEMMASEELASRSPASLEILSGPEPLRFDEQGNLLPW